MFSWENIRRKSKPVITIASVLAFVVMLMPSLILIMRMPTVATKNAAESSNSTKVQGNATTGVKATIEISTTAKSPSKLRRSEESEDALRPSLKIMTTTTIGTTSSTTTLTETSNITATDLKLAAEYTANSSLPMSIS